MRDKKSEEREQQDAAYHAEQNRDGEWTALKVTEYETSRYAESALVRNEQVGARQVAKLPYHGLFRFVSILQYVSRRRNSEVWLSKDVSKETRTEYSLAGP